MEKIYEGVSFNPSPFVTTILAPQLKHKQLPLHVVSTQDLFLQETKAYALIDNYTAERLDRYDSTALQKFLEKYTTAVILASDHNFKVHSHFLDLGFSHILEIPIATELVVKTIENSVKKQAQKVPASTNYPIDTHHSPFTYLHDNSGCSYLVSGHKACYLTTAEKGILEYLQRRNGYATKQELSYAGWKHFDIKNNTVTVTVKKLRHKLVEHKLPYRIKCLYGYGYLLESLFADLGGDHESH